MSAHQNLSHDAAEAATGTVANSNESDHLRTAGLISAGETAQSAHRPGSCRGSARRSAMPGAKCRATSGGWSASPPSRLIWVAQLWLVQAKPLVSPQDAGPRFSAVAPFVRVVFDLLFVGIFCFALGRVGLVVTALASFGIDLFLVTYWHYFSRPLSMLTVVHQWGEGSPGRLARQGHLAG